MRCGVSGSNFAFAMAVLAAVLWGRAFDPVESENEKGMAYGGAIETATGTCREEEGAGSVRCGGGAGSDTNVYAREQWAAPTSTIQLSDTQQLDSMVSSKTVSPRPTATATATCTLRYCGYKL